MAEQTPITPGDLSFTHVLESRPSDKWSPFTRDTTGGFASSALTGYTNIVKTGSPTETVTDGVYSASNAGATTEAWYRSNTAVPNVGYNVEVELAAWGGGAADKLLVGVYKDSTNWAAARVDRSAGTIKLNYRFGGAETTYTSSTVTVALAAGTKVLFQVCKRWAAIWYKRPADSDYVFATCKELGGFNWEVTTTLATWYPFWGVAQSAGSATTVTNFETGHGGALAFQNPRIVKDITTGGPLLSSDRGSVYVTSNGGMVSAAASSDIESAWTLDVWRMDLATYVLTNVSRLWFRIGTKTAAEVPCALAWNPATETWTVIVSNWSEYHTTKTVDLYWVQTSDDLLDGVHYLSPALLDIPRASVSNYDADVVLVSGEYYVSHVVTSTRVNAGWTFKPKLVKSATMGGTFSDVWVSSTNGYEGTIIASVGGSRYVCAAGTGTTQIRVFNFADGTNTYNLNNVTSGSASATFLSGTAISPHPALFAVPNGSDGTRYFIATFDDTKLNPSGTAEMHWTWGDMRVFEAAEEWSSEEHDWVAYASSPAPAAASIGRSAVTGGFNIGSVAVSFG